MLLSRINQSSTTGSSTSRWTPRTPGNPSAEKTHGDWRMLTVEVFHCLLLATLKPMVAIAESIVSLLAQEQMYVLNDNHEILFVCSGEKWKGWSGSGYRWKTVWRQGTWKKALLCVLGTEAHRGQTMLLVPQRQQRRDLHSLQWGTQWIPRGEMHRFSKNKFKFYCF